MESPCDLISLSARLELDLHAGPVKDLLTFAVGQRCIAGSNREILNGQRIFQLIFQLHQFGFRDVLGTATGQIDHQLADKLDVQRLAVGAFVPVDASVVVQEIFGLIDLGANDHILAVTHGIIPF